MEFQRSQSNLEIFYLHQKITIQNKKSKTQSILLKRKYNIMG